MKQISTIQYMKPITIKTSILIFISIVIGIFQYSQITKICTGHVKYTTELNSSTTYTFSECYGMQMETSLLFNFVYGITFISIIIFILKLLSCWIAYIFEKDTKDS